MNKFARTARWLKFTAAILVLVGCTPSTALLPTATAGPEVAATSSQTALAQPVACENHFVTHNLDVYNGIKIRDIATYLSNGSGLAVNDLNGDGLQDIVLGRIDGETMILWNQGNLAFKEEGLADEQVRGVWAVDVDGDGQIDLALTHTGTQEVSYWHNQRGKFTRSSLPGVTYRAYSLGWADMNGDGMLDMVSGSYNTDLKQHMTDQAALNQTTGIVYYQQTPNGFSAQLLDQKADTLSVALLDLNEDGKPDIWTANDFLTPDKIWFQQANGLQPAKPFSRTSYSTMSIDWGDLNNNSQNDLFTSDMNPYDTSVHNTAVWLPVMDALEQGHDPNDPQTMANMVEVPDGIGKYQNTAPHWGVDASGWSWAGRFGDLNNDGFLDLYIVNGMIASNLFNHLPNYELIEENQAFRNTGKGRFTYATEWGLNATTSGRGMVMADLNMDGKLDIIVDNLRGPAQIFENRLCGGDALEVDLRWPESKNPFAIGAQLELHTSVGVLRRDVRASGGYLSTDPTRMHFGFPAGTQLKELLVRWPDGKVSRIQDLQVHSLLKVTR
jgi:enediyne biosynthesis protein E4